MHSKASHLFGVPYYSPVTPAACALWKIMMSSAKTHAQVTLLSDPSTSSAERSQETHTTS